MFNTPPQTMVNTRSILRKKQEQMEKEGQEQDKTEPPHQDSKPNTELKGQTSKKGIELNRTICLNEGSLVKSEPPLKTVPLLLTTPENRRAVSNMTSTSSVAALKAKLELEAAEAKAKIQMELIDKRLAVELAEVEGSCSRSHKSKNSTNSEVEKWLERSQLLEQELEVQPAPDQGQTSGEPCPLTSHDVGTDKGTVHLLASALKDLTTASTKNGPNSSLLSRICTPRDLPSFAGDPMEWLHFKQAYDESTQVCNFTPKENLWRLRKCLRGPAREAVTALLISCTTPEMIISTLELQFGNPDLILSRIMMDIKKLQPVSQEYHKDIVSFSVKVRNCVAAVSVIGRDEYLVATNVITNVLTKLPTVLLSKWADYSYPLITQGKRPSLHTLSEFLHTEAMKVNSMAIINTRSTYYGTNNRKNQEPAPTRSHSVLVNKEVTGKEKCQYCRTSIHKLTDCKKFKKSLRKDRWAFVKRHRLCYKCLLTTHDRETCPAEVCDVDNCGLKHHRLLHYKQETRTSGREAVEDQEQEQREPSEGQQSSQRESETVTHINSRSECKVLLKVVRVNIHGPNGTLSVCALLDDGSTVSLISAGLTSRLGLQGRRDTMRVRGAWDRDELLCETDVVRLRITACSGQDYELKARSVKELNLPAQSLCIVNCNNYNHLKKLKLDLCGKNVKPELLIGQDNYNLLLPLGYKVGQLNEPCATLTPLGWCVHGRVPVASSRERHTTLLIGDEDSRLARDEDRIILQQLDEQVRKSFTFESMGISGKLRQNADEVRAMEHLEKTSVLINGRWHISLPWRDPNCTMPNSEPLALTRFRGVERKMALNEEFSKRYKERVQHLFDNDFAAEVSDSKNICKKIWYLPHFAVDNPNKKKLRLVFDAAAKTEGLSLNDYLLKGPDMLTSLFGIMLRFREHKVAIAGDIKDMFLQIKILNDDQNALRFLWRNNSTSPIQTYKMTSLIFGANCSPFIAQYIRDKNASRFNSLMPSAVEAIRKQHYMDDYIDSQPDDSTSIDLAKNISYIHNEGGFVVCNWLSNSAEVVNSLPNETLANNAFKLKIGQQLDGERTLGLLWFPLEDTLGFDVSFKRIPAEIMAGKRPTKREALQVIMSIFDVYGFLSPFTINGKIILQRTWKAKINWDEQINDEIYIIWQKWLDNLKSISGIRLPRCYQHVCVRAADTPCLQQVIGAPPPARPSQSYSNLELHVFSDGSTQAMCTVAYWRWIIENKINVAFVSSKCRVAPVKPTTVPRLELQAALMAARLADTIQTEHRIKAKRILFWCDSTTVLQWIRNDKRNYKTFVAHRLGEIDELTNINDWRYIPTSLNVADIGTRECYDLTVLQKDWFAGPKFLYEHESSWPADVTPGTCNKSSCDIESVSTIQNEVSEDLPVPNPNRFSSWLRLVRSTSAVLKFVEKCKRTLTSECMLMARAENLLIRRSQRNSFSADIAEIKNGQCNMRKSSRLLTLSPFLDEDGILRAGGRIDTAADVPVDLKQPVILDGKDHITRLLVQHYHVKAMHGSQELVVNELKQKYWILKIRPTVKYVVSRCMLCKIKKTKPEIPRMGDLPAGRVAHHQKPFTHCGVDLFGPMEVTVGRQRQKRYGVLFTCLTVRAIHIELVPSLTTDSLLMAIRRMAARRGWPGHLYSDNGTNLRGAEAEIRKSIQELDEDVLKNTTCTYGTQWTFIPPASPNWGGAWERLIKSVKIALGVVLKERAPRDEVLITLLAEVENIVNSRPLSHVSVEAGSKESLTPNHFLLGSSSNLPQLGKFDDSDLYLRKQWRKAQALADMFWRRWVREVLPEMVPRKRWNQDPQRPLAVGDLVFLVSPDSPRGMWPRGIIDATFPGKDGRVRVVAVRTANGTLKRSVGRVARIPIEDECCQGSTKGGSVGNGA